MSAKNTVKKVLMHHKTKTTDTRNSWKMMKMYNDGTTTLQEEASLQQMSSCDDSDCSVRETTNTNTGHPLQRVP